MTAPRPGTIAIVGLGLIGGSLAKDLAALGLDVIGCDADADSARAALDAGAIRAALDASLDGIEQADVIVLALPVAAAAALIRAHAERLKHARLITDTGSTKSGIAEAARAVGIGPRFVGGHPFAGDDRSCWSAARPGLFAGARVLLCPEERTLPEAYALAEHIWRLVGGVPERTDPVEHDRHLAWTSHLPQMVASALAHTLADAGIRTGELGSGGRSVTRLAGSSPEMWAPIAEENGAGIAGTLESFTASIARLQRALENGDAAALHTFLARSQAWVAPANGARPERTVPDGPRVAFQGELGAHSEEAARRFFEDSVTPLPCRTFADVAGAVLDGRAAYGVLPVENTTAGSIVASYEVLARPGVEILGEIVRPIRHAILGVPGASLGRVRRVLSHPVALAQCATFLAARPWLEGVAYHDTAGAAREVAQAGDPTVAALAARDVASRYGLDVIAADVEDREDNRTRFVIIGPAGPAIARTDRSAPMKSMLFIDVANVPGSLARVLAAFAERNVNLAHIQSTPGDVPWCYRFIIEIEADARNGAAAAAIGQIRRSGGSVRVLGAYPVREAAQRSVPPAVAR